jgi:hypothetical protein
MEQLPQDQQPHQIFHRQDGKPLFVVSAMSDNMKLAGTTITDGLFDPEIGISCFFSLNLEMNVGESSTPNIRAVIASGVLLTTACFKAMRREIVSEFEFTSFPLVSAVDALLRHTSPP